MLTYALWVLMMVIAPAFALAQPSSPTFTRDVAPILLAHCSSCHRPAGTGPFSLVAFEDVRPRAREVVRAVTTRRMPPWKPEPGFGEFEGARRLSDREVAILQTWETRGFPRGNAADLAEAPQSVDGWQLGEPDLVVTLPESYALPAGAGDVFRTFVMPISSEAVRFVKAIEFRPTPPAAVHHANIKIDRTRSSRLLDQQEPGPGYDGGASRRAEFPDGHFLGWTPGQSPRVFPADMAWRLERDTDLVVEAHLMASKDVQRVQLSVGLYFTDRPPSRAPYTLRLTRQDIDLAPGSRVVLTDSFVLPIGVDVIGIQPHAHYLAKEVRAFATLPDGMRKHLILIKDWDFHWQDSYRYTMPMRLPVGTTLTFQYSYDNTAMNRRNPNHPPQRVTFGQTTASEMASLWIQVVPDTAADRRMLDAQFGVKLLRDDIAGYEKMLEIAPGDARVHTALGHAYQEAGRLMEATAHFERAGQLAPTFTAEYDLGSVLLDRKQWAGAASHFTEALRHKPDFAEALYGLGVAHHQQGQLEAAIAAYQQALRHDLRYGDAHYNLARALAAAGRPTPAIAEYRRALELNPSDAEAHSSLGALLATGNQIEDAVAHYKAALAIAPDLQAALVDLAWILATTGHPTIRDPSAAVRLAGRAAELTHRRDAAVLDTLSVAHAEAGDLDAAIASARAALRLAVEQGQVEFAARVRLRLDAYVQHRR